MARSGPGQGGNGQLGDNTASQRNQPLSQRQHGQFVSDRHHGHSGRHDSFSGPEK